MRNLIPLLILATACGGTASPEPTSTQEGGASSGGESQGSSGSRQVAGGAGGDESIAGAAGDLVGAGAGGQASGGSGAAGEDGEGGSAGEALGGAAGAAGEAAGGTGEGGASSGGASGGGASDGGAGGEPATIDAPPWKHCNGVICTADQVCVSDYANNRMCVKINDELNNCIPDNAAPTSILEKCAALRPECQQTWRKCGLMTYNDAGDNCGVYTHHPAAGGVRWSCGPQP